MAVYQEISCDIPPVWATKSSTDWVCCQCWDREGESHQYLMLILTVRKAAQKDRDPNLALGKPHGFASYATKLASWEHLGMIEDPNYHPGGQA